MSTAMERYQGVIPVSYTHLILAGTGLLLLPNSTYPGITLSFTDALFTSTSAVCVTGLNAVDFAHTFTPLGEMFTLALIQIGGFGIDVYKRQRHGP